MGTRAGWDAKLKNAQVYKAERYTPAQKPEKEAGCEKDKGSQRKRKWRGLKNRIKAE